MAPFYYGYIPYVGSQAKFTQLHVWLLLLLLFGAPVSKTKSKIMSRKRIRSRMKIKLRTWLPG
jgi:hypothetical protein